LRSARAAILLALAAALAAAATAAASPPKPADLHVVGDEGWRADAEFSLDWSEPPEAYPPLIRTRYRVRDPLGTTVADGTLNRVVDGAGPLVVPDVPGTYSAEVWFEDAAGEPGPAADAPLRFDDTRPGAVAPGPVPEWIGRTALPLRVRLSHPAGPPPLAGIRGYAAAIDADPGGAPCAAPDRCSEAETTLPGGVGEDELSLASPPEGTSYLHVVAVSGAGMKSATSGEAVLHVDTADPVTHLHGAPEGWTNHAVQLTASAEDGGSGMAAAVGGATPFTAIRVDDGAPAIAPGASVTTSVIAEGAHRVAYYARDAAGNVDDGAAGNGVQDHAPPAAWVRIDRTPPAVAFANSQDPDDPDLIRVPIADQLSGPDPTLGWVGVRRAGSDDPFEPLPSAPPGAGELRARWDSDARPTGEYEFEAVGYDAAGNLAVATRRANGTPMLLANPLKATTTLSARFNRRGLRRTVSFGRRLLIRGRLTTGLSTALGDAPVRVVERFAAGAHPAKRVSTIRTEPAGTFSLRTPPGPSRTIELSYEGSPTLGRSAGQALEVRVRSRVHLRTSTGAAKVGGKPLVFRGRVAAQAGTIPKNGIPVQLQFRLGHSPWSAFRTIQANRRGHFRYAYRFSDDDSRGARFQFRAYVPAQESWPYEPAGSRPIIVRGY
jgi:hypothetical protein